MQISKLLPAWLLTTASMVFLYSRVPAYFYPVEFIRPLIVLWGLLFLLFLPAYRITRDWNWAGLLLVVLVLGLFSKPDFVSIYSITIGSILVLLWLASRFLLRRKLGIQHTYFVLNTVSILAILLSLYSMHSMFNAIPASYYQSTWDVTHSKNYIELDAVHSEQPDIYYIVVDGYGRSDILKQLYGFDNAEFVDQLRQRGFVIPGKSRANYPRTVLSVTSTLNMSYIDGLVPGLEKTSLWWLMSPWLDHNLVRTSLEKIGYTSVSISTDWSIIDNPTTDYYFKSHPLILSEFERYIFANTPLHAVAPAMENMASVPTYNSHRRTQLNDFDSLGKSTSIPGPKFVFAHILMPHPPFVFSSTGEPVDPDYSYTLNDVEGSGFSESSAEYRKQYVDQVQFLNHELEGVIDTILKNSSRPPIIILQADHGPRLLTDFASANRTCLLEGVSTFSAYYLPGMQANEIPDDITPVNLFRIIFDHYFNARLALLRNAQYYPAEGQPFYNFEDVTSRVDGKSNCGLNEALATSE